MQAGNRRLSPLRATPAVGLTLLLVLPQTPPYPRRAPGGGGGGGAGQGTRCAFKALPSAGVASP